MCGGLSRCLFLRLFLALLLLGLAIFSVSAQQLPNLQTPSVSSQSTDSPQTQDTQSLSDLLTELENAANEQAEDLRKLLEQLGQSQIEVSELSILLDLSEKQLQSLQEARMAEREQSRKALSLAIERGARAEAEAAKWKYFTFAAGGLAIAGWIAFAVAMSL